MDYKRFTKVSPQALDDLDQAHKILSGKTSNLLKNATQFVEDMQENAESFYNK